MSYKARFDDHRLFGVELEVCGVNRNMLLGYLTRAGVRAEITSYTKAILPTWRLSDDRSIEGEHPTEVISPLLKGRDGLAEVENVVKALSLAGCYVNHTCGYHVHWNVQDYTGKNVLSILRLYAKFENVIDYLVSPSRRGNGNPYCRTMVKDRDLSWVTTLDRTERRRAVDVALAFDHTHSEYILNEYNERVERGSRYHKLNISAYTQYGSVEFRQHQGTVNVEKVINWIVFTQQLVSKAKEVSVSRKTSAKPTLGEMLRVLRLVDHQLIDDRCTDPLVIHLGGWLKRRYSEFRGGWSGE